VIIGFTGRFILKQYMPGKPTKWGIKAWGITDSNRVPPEVQNLFGKKKKKSETVSFSWWSKLLLT
jgi:hypothetical protein